MAAAGAGADSRPRHFGSVLFDSRYGASRAFGAAAARSGHATAALRGDVTGLWLSHLDPHWAGGGGAVAGMTTAASLFCLEQMAKDHWLRVVVRIDHRRSSSIGAGPAATAADPAVIRACLALSRAACAGSAAGVDLVSWVIAKS